MRFLLPFLILSLALPTLAEKKSAARKVAQTPPKSSAIPDRREFPLNPDINPCENFYDHVCSKVIDSFQLREDRSSHTFSFSDSADRILETKKKYFRQLASRPASSSREEGLKNYYMACMDPKARARDERQEVARIKKMVDELRTRPALRTWIEKSYLSTETSPLGWGAIANMDRPLRNDLYMDTGWTTLPEKGYYKKPEIMADFRQLALLFFKTIGEKNPDKMADALLKFESVVAEAHPAPEEMRQIINNRSFITAEQLLRDFPSLAMDSLLKEIPKDTIIRHWVPDAMKKMDEFLNTAEFEDVRAVLLFNSLYETLDDAYPAFFKAKFEFDKKHFGGPNQRAERQERCTKKVMNSFTKELDFILLPQMFPNFPKEKFIALAEKVRASLLRSLEQNQWLTKGAKAEAINKMKKARLFLIGPETEAQWDFLPQAKYGPTSPLENVRTLSRVLQQKTLHELKTETDPGKWDMGPLTVNAYYDPSYNKFVMPIGILQYPFYDPSLPEELNLAAVGSVIGHELGHGVDDEGSRYDADGKQRLWMTTADLGGFSKRTELLISQFDAIGHNGRLTLGENIGDLVGVTASLSAASQDPSFLKSPERMKGYFQAYARLWCTVARPKFEQMLLKTDPHSLGYARVNQQVRQQPEFKKIYQCKDGDAMTLPQDKLVHIW